jgi:hypothetical protein
MSCRTSRQQQTTAVVLLYTGLYRSVILEVGGLVLSFLYSLFSRNESIFGRSFI